MCYEKIIKPNKSPYEKCLYYSVLYSKNNVVKCFEMAPRNIEEFFSILKGAKEEFGFEQIIKIEIHS